ncbi:MAG: flavin-containing monooxygenase, partial [Actinomycetes bacterium]
LQIACELAATRPVTVAVGTRSPMLPQRLLGRDLFWWLSRLGLLTKTADSRLARRVRNKGDLVIGTRWRDLTRRGVQVRSRLDDVDLTTAMFADGTVTQVAAVVWATGFRTDYAWLDIPGAVVGGAVPNERGLTPVPGLSILGLPWLHTRGSALLGFVKDDAAWLGAQVARQSRAAPPAAPVAPVDGLLV